MAFRQRIVITGRHFMVKVSVRQEDIKIVITCAPNSRTPPSNSGVHIQVHMEYCVGPTIW